MLASLAALAAATHAAAEKKGGLPQLNPHDFAPQLIWLALTFGVLYFVLSRVSLPRISEVIEERRDRIQRDLDEAARLKGETEKALAGYEQARAEARAKAGGIARDMQERGAAEADKERVRVETQITAKMAEADARISTLKTRALAGINDIASDTAGAIVNRLIGQDVSADEIRNALASVKPAQ
jgi:F-type H+-transporting ATPase subunit b